MHFDEASSFNSQSAKPWHAQAARAAWIAPIIAVVLNVLVGGNAKDRNTIIMVGAIAGVIIVLGLVFSIWGILGALRKGPRGLLVPAGIGMVINGLLALAAVVMFQRFSELAKESQQRAAEADAAAKAWIPAGSGWYIDRRAKFAVRFPKDWEIDAARQPLAALAIRPAADDETKPREVMGVMLLRAEPGGTTDSMLDANIAQLRKDGIGYEEVRRGHETFDGVRWAWVEYRETAGEGKAVVTSAIHVRGEHAYLALFRAHAGTTEEIRKQWRETWETIRMGPN